MQLSVGTVIGGRYRLDHLLGEGGMGAVWAATHTITGGRVALKFIKGAAESEENRKRFLREARATTLVEHPNVVTIRDLFDHEETPVIVMDLLHGETLASLLMREGKLPLGDAARLLLPVIAAVGAAHEAGLIHRDLKPENVFLSRSTQGEVVRVLDFGVAKLVRKDVDEFASTAVTQSGSVIGTPAYMAPEQLFGEKDLDYRVDIWSLGVILYEMLAGKRPIEGDNFGQLAKKMLTKQVPLITETRDDLPEDVVALVTRMLARERDDRLRDLREAATVLAQHGSVARPSFGAPRMRPVEESGEGRVIVGTGTDPNARTMAGPRTTDPTAETILAQSAPRHDTATAHVSPTHTSTRSWQGAAIALLALLAIGVVALRFIPGAPPAPPPPIPASPHAVASPKVMLPTPAPSPTQPAQPEPETVVASASPSATAPAPTTLKPGVKAPKLIPSATPSIVASVTAPPPPPPSTTATQGSGLVTKPPF